MDIPIKLISVRPISPSVSENKIIWLYQMCRNLPDGDQIAEWTPYSSEISTYLENAFSSGLEETFIKKTYRIDFIELLEICTEDPKYQRPIRRCPISLLREFERWTKLDPNHCERLSFRLNTALKCSTSVDTNYYGSQFVSDWLLKFNNGKLHVKVDDIFPVLVNGLKCEGHSEPEKIVNDILHDFDSFKNETCHMSEKQKLKKLQDCCLKLYTKQCYLFRIVNTALRDDDRTKLDTLGPYCYLLYNAIGRFFHDDRPSKLFHRHKSHPMTLYRGDTVPRKIIEEYRQAAGQIDKYFKWLSFVSTSVERAVAEHFALNALFIIHIERYSSMDQYTDLKTNTYFETEQEIVLKPGTRFRVNEVKRDENFGLQIVDISIIPSYVSNLR